jgi:PAS domain S-box-containing protein
MSIPLERVIRILFVEDVAEDVDLALRKIRKDGLECTTKRVDTEQELIKALKDFKPDIVIADYTMPVFNGLRAYHIYHEFNPFIPFIILTGSINEETAVTCMKAGANDYVLKDNMNRLSLAITEAIEHKQLEKKAKLQEEQLRQSEERYRSIFTNSTAIMIILDPDQDGQIVDANNAAVQFYGWPKEVLLTKKIIEINCLPPDEIKARMAAAKEKAQNYFNFRHRTASGEEIEVEVHTGPVQFGGKTYLFSVIHDISERKKAEQQRDILFRELHHRVKNNLQIIASLLNLSMNEIEDPSVIKKLKDINRRIDAMAIVHEQFYESQDLSKIDFDVYVQRLIQFLVNESDIPLVPEVTFQLDTFSLDLDYAIPAGLLISELFALMLEKLSHDSHITPKVAIYLQKQHIADTQQQNIQLVVHPSVLSFSNCIITTSFLDTCFNFICCLDP